MPEEKYIAIFCTVPDETTGVKIGEDLVGSSLAACVNIVPGLTSIYSWQGKIERDNELLLIIKSTNSDYQRLEKRIKELHPYDVPEIIVIDIADGSSDYLNWITDSVL